VILFTYNCFRMKTLVKEQTAFDLLALINILEIVIYFHMLRVTIDGVCINNRI
jgi:hypothetical protein